MRTNSYISAAALAAALMATPQLTLAQGIGLNVDLGIIGVDANVDLGGDKLLDVDAGVNVGGSQGLDVDAGIGVGGQDSSLVDVDLDAGPATSSDAGGSSGSGGPATGPNGGTLVDLNVGPTEEAAVAVDLDVLPRSGGASTGNGLINGDIRIGALSGDAARGDALLGLIANPNLADIDLDAAIDDRRVAIVAAADLLGPDRLADIRAAVDVGGDGRTSLLDALASSTELGAILGSRGIDLSDVLAIQIAENGAAQVFVLDDTVEVALLGDDGDLADLRLADDLADLDIDLLTDDQLATVDLDLLPPAQRTRAQLRLLGPDGNLADLSAPDLAAIDLDLLSQEELAELDLDLLPDALASAVNLRLLGDDGTIAGVSLGDIAAIDLGLTPGAPGGGDPGPTPDPDPGPGTGPGDDGGDPGTNPNPGGGDDDGDDAGNGNGGSPDDSADGDAGAGIPGNGGLPIGSLPPTRVAAGFAIAALGCDIGVLALANGADASPQAIAQAEALELVRIEGCNRTLVDSQAPVFRAAIEANPAISSVLDAAAIPLDRVIGATIQGGTLTLFIEPAVS